MIPIIDEECTLSNFLPFLESNSPVLFRNATAKQGWTLTPSVLTTLASTLEVPVDLPLAAGSSYGIKNRIQIPFDEFLEKATSGTYSGIYLRDWHIDRVCGVCDYYSVFDAFQDDWLNWYWQRIQPLHTQDRDTPDSSPLRDDYSFCYVGSSGSFTGVHFDVCLSYSWSANIAGRKRWSLWAPEHAHVLCGDNEYTAPRTAPVTVTRTSDATRDVVGFYLHNLSTFTLVSDPRDGQYDASKYPHLSDMSKCLTIVQEPGDVIFVPSGWYHCVENMHHEDEDEDTANMQDKPNTQDKANMQDKTQDNSKNATPPLIISINRNWFNSFNLYSVVSFILHDWRAVQLELRPFLPSEHWRHTHAGQVESVCVDIKTDPARAGEGASDCEDASMLMDSPSWYVHCDSILRANCAINLCMLMEILAARLALLLVLDMDSDITDTYQPQPQQPQQQQQAKEPQNYNCSNTDWLRLFCPAFHFVDQYRVDDSDMCLAKLQQRTALPKSAGAGDGGDRGTVWDEQWRKLHAVLTLLHNTAGFCLALAHCLQGCGQHAEQMTESVIEEGHVREALLAMMKDTLSLKEKGK